MPPIRVTRTQADRQSPSGIYAGMQLVDDPVVGAWVRPRLDFTRGSGVRGLVPSGFEAYAVVFHPAFREVGPGEQPSLFAPDWLQDDGTGVVPVRHREVRWAEVADANGRVAHPMMEWAAITGRWDYRYGGKQPGLWDIGPNQGSLPLGPTVRLCEVLASQTATADRCFFGVSVIYGDLPETLMKAPQVLETHLVTGPLAAVPNHSFGRDTMWYDYRSPNLWWPDDRAWFVCSNYDLQETYIGGSDACIAALLADPGLEVMRVDPDQRPVDALNPEPEGEYQG